MLVTIVETRGSTPREVGASMLVFAQHTHGTIGGGELEFQATATARELLREGESSSEQHYVLGARLGQCCGGQANLWFESSDAWQTALPGLDNNKTYVTVTRQQEATRRFLEVNPSGQCSSPNDLPADVLVAIEACADPSCRHCLRGFFQWALAQFRELLCVGRCALARRRAERWRFVSGCHCGTSCW